MQAYDAKTLELKNPMRFRDNIAITRTGTDTYRITGGQNRKGDVGDIAVWSIRETMRPSRRGAVTAGTCAGCTFENVTVYSTPHGCGYAESSADGNRYLGCSLVRRPPETDLFPRALKRLRSGNHDAFNSRCSYVGPTLDRCTFQYHCDDCVNISGFYAFVTEQKGRTLRIAPYGGTLRIDPGDTCQLMTFEGVCLPDAKVGASFAYGPGYAFDCDPRNAEARQNFDELENYWWLDVYCMGDYPMVGEHYARMNGWMPDIPDEDRALFREAAEAMDFIGVNYYHSNVCEYNPPDGAQPFGTPNVTGEQGVDAVTGLPGLYKNPPNPYLRTTDWDWTIDATGLKFACRELTSRYRKPIFITENGLGHFDSVESDGRILLLYHIIYVGHHLVHVLAPPVGHREAAARVLVVGIVFSGACGWHTAGIEVVVEDNPVHVIVLYDFAADGCDAVAGGLERRVQDGGGGSVAVRIADEHAVLLQLQVLRRAPSGRRRGPSVRIDPGMAFHAATVAFLDGELQRVPSRVFPSGAGDVAAPRLEARPIEGVGHGAHLEIDGVEVAGIEDVDVVTQLSLLFVAYRNAGAGRRGPVDAIDRGQPGAAYLALDGGILGRGCQEREAEEGG